MIEERAIINKDYKSFSLFAFLHSCRGVRINGAYYTAGFYDRESLDINLDDRFAQSNFVNADYAEVTLESGVLLLIESND